MFQLRSFSTIPNVQLSDQRPLLHHRLYWRYTAAQQSNYVYEGIACSLPHNTQVSGTQPLLRYWSQSANDHFYTLNRDEISGNLHNFHYQYEGVTGYCSLTPGPNLSPLYRYYQQQNTDHFYTTDESEAAGKGKYVYETVACYVWWMNFSFISLGFEHVSWRLNRFTAIIVNDVLTAEHEVNILYRWWNETLSKEINVKVCNIVFCSSEGVL